MVGEGLGYRTMEEEREKLAKTLFGHSRGSDVVGVGDLLVDRVVHREHPLLEEYVGDDWFPEPGETILTDDYPEELDEAVHATYPGGRGANQALAAARAGAEASLMGTAGNEEELAAYLEDAGVDTRFLALEPGREATSIYIFLDENGDNGIIADSGARMNHRYVNSVLGGAHNPLQNSSYVLMNNGEKDSALHATLSYLDSLDDAPNVIFDPAPADGAKEFLDYGAVDIVTPNKVEYEHLKDELEEFDGTVIRTGSDGPTITDAVTGYDQHIPAPDVSTAGYEVVDTTAAGDVFNGYLAAELSNDEPLGDAVVTATYAASLSVTRHGAQPSIPSYDEVEAFMREARD